MDNGENRPGTARRTLRNVGSCDEELTAGEGDERPVETQKQSQDTPHAQEEATEPETGRGAPPVQHLMDSEWLLQEYLAEVRPKQVSKPLAISQEEIEREPRNRRDPGTTGNGSSGQ